MKLYIKQEVFRALPRFKVLDEQGNEKYDIGTQGMIQVGLKLHIHDMNGTELAVLKQKFFSLTPTFHIFKNDVQTASIVKKITLMKPKYVIEELGWTVEGDFLAHEYTISDSTGVIMTISKEWFSWGDSFVIDMNRSNNEIEAIAVVLAIDCVMDAKEEQVVDNLMN